jgi:cytochrome P450
MLFLLCLIPILIFLCIGKAKRFKSPFKDDHSPKIKLLPTKHFVMGDWNSISNNIENSNEYHTSNIKKYGTHQFSLPFSPIYINLEPNEENLKHILSNNFNNYRKDDEQKTIFGELFGNGIFAADETKSRVLICDFILKNQSQLKVLFQEQVDKLILKNDNLVKKYFDYNDINNYVDCEIPDCEKNTELNTDLINIQFANDNNVINTNLLNDKLINDNSLNDKVINDKVINDKVINKEFESVETLSTIFESVSNYINDDDLSLFNEQIDIQKIFFELTTKSSFQIIFGQNINIDIANKCAEMFDKCQELMYKRYFKPWWKIDRYLNIGDEKIIAAYIKILNEYFDDHFKNPDGLVKYCFDNGLTEKDTRDFLINILISARDITATALTWCMYEIIKNPHLVDELRTRDDFLINFINEVLRLHPSIPADSRMVLNDDILPDGTFLPAKSVIIYRPYSHGRLLYENGNVFNVNRVNNKSSFYLSVFDTGSKICLGKNMALLQIKTVLSTLIKKYKFTGNIYNNPMWIPGITLRMKNGLYVSVNKI